MLTILNIFCTICNEFENFYFGLGIKILVSICGKYLKKIFITRSTLQLFHIWSFQPLTASFKYDRIKLRLFISTVCDLFVKSYQFSFVNDKVIDLFELLLKLTEIIFAIRQRTKNASIGFNDYKEFKNIQPKLTNTAHYFGIISLNGRVKLSLNLTTQPQHAQLKPMNGSGATISIYTSVLKTQFI